MGLFAKLREVDPVVLGADAVFPLHFLNKIGTYALAELAQFRNVPCFALCTANKFLPRAATSLLRITKHSGDEVWSTFPPGVRVHNDYFEEIPVSLLNGVISDQGRRSPEDIQAMLEDRPLSPALLRLRAKPDAAG
jgi:translation initiation factor 2B subunit (eIF-2B alpha/beta/delta family)